MDLLNDMIRIALADGILTASKRQAIEQRARELKVSPESLDSMFAKAQSAIFSPKRGA